MQSIGPRPVREHYDQHTISKFTWLGSTEPPLLVLSTACILKEQSLGVIEMRYANAQAFQVALTNWQNAIANPEDYHHWQQFYADALCDTLRKANNRRKETFS